MGQLPEEKPKILIPDLTKKLFYKIGEVSRITQLEPYVLRYWEKEFAFLAPRKGASGQRVYQKKDIEIILEIRRLLYNERFTIEGVQRRLSKHYMNSIEVVKSPVINKRENNSEKNPPLTPKKSVNKDKNNKDALKTALKSIKEGLIELHKTLV